MRQMPVRVRAWMREWTTLWAILFAVLRGSDLVGGDTFFSASSCAGCACAVCVFSLSLSVHDTCALVWLVLMLRIYRVCARVVGEGVFCVAKTEDGTLKFQKIDNLHINAKIRQSKDDWTKSKK